MQKAKFSINFLVPESEYVAITKAASDDGLSRARFIRNTLAAYTGVLEVLVRADPDEVMGTWKPQAPFKG